MKFRFFSIFKMFDTMRKLVLNLLFWGLIIGAIAFYVVENRVPEIDDNTTLVVNPKGVLTELSSDSEYFSSYYMDDETTVSSLITSLEAAAEDPAISSVFLDLRGLLGGGMSQFQEIGLSLMKIREAGKTITAFSDYYTQGRYYLASYADKIILDPIGELFFTGIGDYGSYFGTGLEKFGIKANVFKAGDYKSAVEPFTASEMSQYAKEASADYLGDLWESYISDIAKARGINKKKIEDYVLNFADILALAKGNSAIAAKTNGFVDKLAIYEFAIAESINDNKLIMINTEEDTEEESIDNENSINIKDESHFEQVTINWKDYYKTISHREKASKGHIAVVVAEGTIADGDLPPGMIGSENYCKILNALRIDDEVKGVVLRIDSGGGGVVASEKIRRCLQGIRDEGKPVIISMGSVAASGAYWISTASDAIFCMPTTITGSIGVFSVLFDISEFLEKYPGVTVDGYGTSEFSTAYRPDIPMTENMKKVMQLSVDDIYNQFIKAVSLGRNLTIAETKRLAGGRVWSGTAALAGEKLADYDGGLIDAIAFAAEKSSLEEYSVVYYGATEDLISSLAKGISGKISKHSGVFRRLKQFVVGTETALGLPPVSGEMLKNGNYAVWPGGKVFIE